MKKTNIKLKRETFESISEEDIFSEAWNDTYDATAKIESNLNKLIKIQNDLTPTIKVKTDWIERHPWLNDKQYRHTKREKTKAHKEFISNPNEVNSSNYKLACRLNFDAFHDLRSKYLLKVMDETKGSTREFFKLIKGSTSKHPT